MRMIKGKFFWKIGDSPKQVINVAYNDTQIEYYTFLKEQFEAGYRQIIVSSEIMIKIIETAVLSDGLFVYEVKLSENDDSMQYEIDTLLNLIEKVPAYFGKLIEKLSCMAEESSIDIARVKIKGYTADRKPVDCFIQSNGLLTVNEDSFDNIQNRLSSLIERCLFA